MVGECWRSRVEIKDYPHRQNHPQVPFRQDLAVLGTQMPGELGGSVHLKISTTTNTNISSTEQHSSAANWQ